MIRVEVSIGSFRDTQVEYEFIEDFIRDAVTADMVEQWLTEIYSEVKIEGLLSIPAGRFIRKCGGSDLWDDLTEDFIACEAEFIEDVLESDEECDWYDYHLIKRD